MDYFIIGERELVLAFSLVGVSGAVAVNRDEALDAFNRVTGKGGAVSSPTSGKRPKILILTEQVAMFLEKEIMEWQLGADYPLVVEIPGINGHMSGRRTLTDSIREAIGIQV